MLQTFSFQSMFRGVHPTDVKKMASNVTCCATGQQVDHMTWLVIVKDGGQMKFCLPEHVNGRTTLVPSREVVERITPGFAQMDLTLLDRYATSVRKTRRAKTVGS